MYNPMNYIVCKHKWSSWGKPMPDSIREEFSHLNIPEDAKYENNSEGVFLSYYDKDGVLVSVGFKR